LSGNIQIYLWILSEKYMKRDIIQELKLWKDSEGRKPLLLRGARQTGKTFAAQQFGTEEFQNTIYLNL